MVTSQPDSRNSSDSTRPSPTNSTDDSRPRPRQSIWRYNVRRRSTLYSKGKDPILIDESTRLHKFRLKSRTDSTADEFDFMRDRDISKSTNLKGGIAALAKGCLGIGVTIVHEAFMMCGLWTGLIWTLCLGIVIGYCMHELVRAAQKMYKIVQVSTMSYPDLAEATLEMGPCNWLTRKSRCFRHLVEAFLCVNSFGACVVDQVLIGRQLKQIGDTGSTRRLDTKHAYTAFSLQSKRTYIASMLVPCAVASFLTNLKHFAPFSVVADFCIGLTALSTVYYGSNGAGSISPLQRPFFNSTMGMFKGTGMLLFAMNGIDTSLAVENSIKNPEEFPLVVVGGMTVVLIVVMIYGFFGAWGFGESCATPVTFNFPWYPFAITVKMFFAMVVYLVYPLYFYVPFHQVWYYISSFHDPDKHWIWERVYRVLISIICSLIAIAVPSVAHLAGLVGGFTMSILGVVFPVLISLNLDWKDPGPGKFYWRVWKTVVIVLFGLVLCGCSTAANMKFIMFYYLGLRL